MTTMNKTTKQKLVELFSQASTWKGILGLATAFGVVIAPDQMEAIIAAGLILIGIIQITIDN